MIHRSGGGEIKSTLTLPTAEEQDRGQYLCVAENKVLDIVKHLVFDHYDEDDKISKDGNNHHHRLSQAGRAEANFTLAVGYFAGSGPLQARFSCPQTHIFLWINNSMNMTTKHKTI